MMEQTEILLETRRVGNVLCICAMEVPSLNEVRFQAPVGLSNGELAMMARQKLAARGKGERKVGS